MTVEPSMAGKGTYLGEFLVHWRALLAASIGLIAGTTSIYINNLFSPYLIAEFGWEKSDFALIGLTTAIAVVFLPVAGRLADKFGMRRIATAGVAALPLVFVGLALQPGSFVVFFILSTFQMLIMSAVTGIVVYGRLIARYFNVSRGLALGVASCMPALAAALFSPLLSMFLETFGWRNAYLFMAVFAAIMGASALLLVPRGFRDRDTRPPEMRSARRDYGEIFGSRAFWVIFGAMLLVNLHFTMQTTQLTLIVQEKGIEAAAASIMISVFAIGVIIGRIVCGLALDRYPPQLVATVCFLFPATGLAVLASGTNSYILSALGVMSLGFSVGAEGDVAAYLTTRYFRPELFSSVLGLFTSAMAISALFGALVISRTLAMTGSYALFLSIASISVFAGAVSFLLLGKGAPVNRAVSHS